MARSARKLGSVCRDESFSNEFDHHNWLTFLDHISSSRQLCTEQEFRRRALDDSDGKPGAKVAGWVTPSCQEPAR